MKASEPEVEEDWREESDEGQANDYSTEESLGRKLYGKPKTPNIPLTLLQQRSSSQFS